MTPVELNLLDALRSYVAAQSAVPTHHATAHARHDTVTLAATLTGLTAKAIRRKIEEGKWLDGREYHRRDGSIFIDMKGYESWVERGRR